MLIRKGSFIVFNVINVKVKVYLIVVVLASCRSTWVPAIRTPQASPPSTTRSSLLCSRQACLPSWLRRSHAPWQPKFWGEV